MKALHIALIVACALIAIFAMTKELFITSFFFGGLTTLIVVDFILYLKQNKN